MHHCQLFEDFVLVNRRYLKEELRLCERACQKILMYSNNFLHKSLKTASNKGPRVERSVGRNALGLLKPIRDLPGEACCANKCVTLALSHSRLLELWRTQATLGQRSQRRVIALMLIPSGGSKANCYKFITLVTGCSFSTICQVNEHMKKTQGELEPPEHGLKKRWCSHSSSNERSNATEAASCGTDCLNEENEDDPAIEVIASNIHIPTAEELGLLTPEEAAGQLESILQRLVQFHKLLTKKKQQLESQEQTISKQVSRKSNTNITNDLTKTDEFLDEKRENVREEVRNAQTIQTKTSTVLERVDPRKVATRVIPRASSQHLLHILELPASVPSVITNLENCHQSQSTISLMTASGEFEPLALDLRNAAPGTFSNIVLLPEVTLEPSTIMTEADVLQQNTYNASVPGVKTNNYQLYNVNLDPATTNLLQFNY